MLTGAQKKISPRGNCLRYFWSHLSLMKDSKEERIRRLEAALAVAERVKNGFLAANLREVLRDALKET